MVIYFSLYQSKLHFHVTLLAPFLGPHHLFTKKRGPNQWLMAYRHSSHHRLLNETNIWSHYFQFYNFASIQLNWLIPRLKCRNMIHLYKRLDYFHTSNAVQLIQSLSCCWKSLSERKWRRRAWCFLLCFLKIFFHDKCHRIQSLFQENLSKLNTCFWSQNHTRVSIFIFCSQRIVYCWTFTKDIVSTWIYK